MNDSAKFYADAPQEYIGRVLDARGVTLVDMIDQASGELVAAVTWEDMRRVLQFEHDTLVMAEEARLTGISIDPELIEDPQTAPAPTWRRANAGEIASWVGAGAAGIVILQIIGLIGWTLITGGW